MRVTYEKILLFRQNAENYKRPHRGKFSPFLYAIEKLLNATKEAADDYNDRVKKINMDHAEKDKEGFFMYSKSNGPMGEQDNFKFKPENEVKRDADVRALLVKEYPKEIEPYILPDLFERLPKDLDFSWWEVFSPFVLPDLTAEIEQKLFVLQEERDKKK